MRRRSLSSVGKPYDAEVDFLQWVSVAGTDSSHPNFQWIDLGIICTALPITISMELMINMNYTDVILTPCLIGGSPEVSPNTREWICSFPLNKGFTVNCALAYNSISTRKITPYVYHKVEIVFEQGKQILKVDGETYCEATNTMSLTSEFNKNLLIGRPYDWGDNSCFGNPLRFKLRNFRITSASGNRDLIPVRKGTVGYMYDRANPNGGTLGNGLYPNAGTGSFLFGSDRL